MPNKQYVIEWQVAQADGRRKQARKQGQITLCLKKLCVNREEFWMEDFFNAGQVNLGIFGVGMVTMHRQCP